MKFFLKVKNGFGWLILLLCLGLTFASSQSAKAAPGKIIGSAEDHGIKLTINNYELKNYGQEMVVYYTVQSKSGNPMEGKSLINKPDFTIGDRFVQGIDSWHKKVGSQQYQGAVKVELPQYRPAVSDVEFNTDAIFNQKGNWTITFQIKK